MLKGVGKVQQEAHPQFALLLGDFLAYKINEDYMKFSGDTTQEGYEHFIKKTIQFLTQEIKQKLPKTTIYPVVGNNDSYTGDYGIVPNGKFFAETGNTWNSFLIDQESRQSFLQDFKTSGYYSAIIPHT